MRRDLRDDWIRALEAPPTGRVEIWDTRIAGLCFRLTPSGSGTWTLRTRTRDGKQTRVTLGTWPSIGTVEARKRAIGALAAVQAGGDPSAEKREAKRAREARAVEASVATALKAWREAHEAGPRAWSERYTREVRRICARDIEPVLGKRILRETVRADWTALVAARRRTAPAMAALLYRVISAFLNYAEAQGWIETSLLPRKGAAMLAPAPASRDRVLSDEELVEVWRAACAEDPKARVFMMLLMLCAVRATEAAGIATDELDLDAGRWHLPAKRAKNKRGYTLPVPENVGRLLRDMVATQQFEHPHCILGARSGPFQAISKLKARIDARITQERADKSPTPKPMPPWRLHDLRRTARTGMTRLGVPREHAEMAINHISGRSSLERTYDRHDYAAEVVAALKAWQNHLLRLVTVERG